MNRGFRAIWLPLGAAGLMRSRVRNLLDGLVDLRKIILIHLRSLRLLAFLRLRRRIEWRRGGNRHRCLLSERCGGLGKIGNRSGAEVRKVRNGLKTIENGSQIG
jgi:hypothetical protein